MNEQIILAADFKNNDANGRIRSNTNGTILDLERQSLILTQGLSVLLKDYNDLVVKGMVEFSDTEHIWVAKINWDNIKSV